MCDLVVEIVQGDSIGELFVLFVFSKFLSFLESETHKCLWTIIFGCVGSTVEFLCDQIKH